MTSQDLRGAFYKFDEHHSGRLDRASFRRMLDAFMCFVNDTEFNRLCSRCVFLLWNATGARMA